MVLVLADVAGSRGLRAAGAAIGFALKDETVRRATKTTTDAGSSTFLLVARERGADLTFYIFGQLPWTGRSISLIDDIKLTEILSATSCPNTSSLATAVVFFADTSSSRESGCSSLAEALALVVPEGIHLQAK